MKLDTIAANDNKPEITILKCLACLLITNSHLDALYPSTIRPLATGGALGNAFFFFLSGYALQCSYRKKRGSYANWYVRRLIKIYPAFLIVAFYEFFTQAYWHRFDINDYISFFVWPTAAWFIGAIMLFYSIYYFVMKKNDQKIYLYSIIVVSSIYFLWYAKFVDFNKYSIEGPYYFKWSFYFIVMLCGGYVSFRDNNTRIREVYLIPIGLTLYFGFGFFLVKGYFLQYQFIMHILTVVIVYTLFTFVASSRRVINWFRKYRVIDWIVSFIASLTLEVYLVQYQVYSSSWIKNVAFPLNILFFSCLTLFLAYIISRLTGLLTNLRYFKANQRQAV